LAENRIQSIKDDTSLRPGRVFDRDGKRTEASIRVMDRLRDKIEAADKFLTDESVIASLPSPTYCTRWGFDKASYIDIEQRVASRTNTHSLTPAQAEEYRDSLVNAMLESLSHFSTDRLEKIQKAGVSMLTVISRSCPELLPQI